MEILTEEITLPLKMAGAGWSETVKDSADGYSYANIGWASFDAAVII